MSSYYTTAQLEAMRKEKLKADLLSGIEKLATQLRTEYKNDVESCKSQNIVNSIFMEDEEISGCEEINVVDINFVNSSFASYNAEHDELDFSKLLIVNDIDNPLETELNAWISKIDNRIIFSEKDEQDRSRLMEVLGKIISDGQLDIEDKIKAVRMRVDAYLQGAYVLTDNDKNELTNEYFEYVALCQMLDLTPNEKYPYRIKKEITRMKNVLEKRTQDEYIMETVQNIMTELGCNLKEEAILDHVMGHKFSINRHEICDIFVGNDGSGIMFEPIVEANTKRTIEQRKIESDIGYVCSLYKELEDKAFEAGVILNRVYLETIDVQQCCSEEKVSVQKSKRKKSISQKLKMISQEG